MTGNDSAQMKGRCFQAHWMAPALTRRQSQKLAVGVPAEGPEDRSHEGKAGRGTLRGGARGPLALPSRSPGHGTARVTHAGDDPPKRRRWGRSRAGSGPQLTSVGGEGAGHWCPGGGGRA